MKRRDFLCVLLMINEPTISFAAIRHAADENAYDRVIKKLFELSRFPASAACLSQQCCAETVSPMSDLEAFQRLSSQLGRSSSWVAVHDDAGLRRAIGELIQDDFENARTIEVDGWILSETEILCCHLITCCDGAHNL